MTDRKVSESKLQRGDERFRTYMKSSTEAIWCFELEQPVAIDLPEDEQIDLLYKYVCISDANDAWARMAGYEKGMELEGWRLEDIMPRSMPESIAALREIVQAHYNLDDFETFEFYKNGVKLIALNNINGVIEDGYLLKIWGTARDITEEKLAKEELTKSQRILADAQKIAHLGSWEWNIQDNSEAWSDEQFRIFGYEPGEIEPTYDHFIEALHPDDRNRVIDAVKSALDDTKSYNIEFRIIRPDLTVRTVSAQGEVYRDEQNNPIRMLGTALDISERRQIENELRYKHKDLQKLAGRLISTQEEELRRLARELHDDLTQRLAVLAIDIGNLELQFKDDLPEPAIKQVSQIKANVIKISGDVHNLSRDLHPSILEDLGLVRAIQSQCNDFSSRMGIAVVFTPKNVPVSLPHPISLTIYRIIQEGLSNIASYAKTKNAYVFLEELENNILLSVRDTGVGFDPAKVKLQAGLGLGSMRERVRLVDGSLSITSEPGKGTDIEVKIPLKKEKFPDIVP